MFIEVNKKMKNDSLKDKTTKKLQTGLAAIKVLAIILSILVTVLVSITIYGMTNDQEKRTFISLFIFAISSSTSLFILFWSIKRIKTELKSREN